MMAVLMAVAVLAQPVCVEVKETQEIEAEGAALVASLSFTDGTGHVLSDTITSSVTDFILPKSCP